MDPNQQKPFKLYRPLPRYGKPDSGWGSVIVLVIVVALTVVVVRFFDSIHYHQKINQAVQQQSSDETKIGKDFSKLLNQVPGPIDCSVFSTNFASQQCQEHNKQ